MTTPTNTTARYFYDDTTLTKWRVNPDGSIQFWAHVHSMWVDDAEGHTLDGFLGDPGVRETMPTTDTTKRMLEHCRACRDEFDQIVPAEFIIWGKLTPPEHLGPRCYDHTAEFVSPMGMSRIDQWAIFDLRPFMAAAESSRGGES